MAATKAIHFPCNAQLKLSCACPTFLDFKSHSSSPDLPRSVDATGLNANGASPASAIRGNGA